MELHEKAIIKEKAMLQFFYPVHPGLSDMLTRWELLRYHVYDYREGHEALKRISKYR